MLRKQNTQAERQQVRPAAVAGRFYPGDPSELRTVVTALLAGVHRAPGPAPKAIIVPHAGYPYSGPIAASAYAQLQVARDVINRIILVGPSHRVAVEGIAGCTAEAFTTPLGLVPVDAESVKSALALPQVSIVDEAHRYEHALEVQLPFLQVALGHFSIVPLVVGEATAEQVSQVINALWGGPETRLVISSDLSHYLDYQSARKLDELTAKAIEALDPDGVGETQACGRIPIRGLLLAARKHGLHPRAFDLRTSGDTAGPRAQVVGYGAFLFQDY